MTVHLNRVTALPVHDGPGICDGCQTVPGRDHGLSCPAISPEQFLAFIRRDFVPHPDAVRNFRGPLIGALPGLALFFVFVIWSLT